MYRLLVRSRLIYAAVLGMAFAPGVVVGLGLLQEAQAYYFPVIDSFYISKREVNALGNPVISGVLRKKYSSCRYAGATWVAHTEEGIDVRLGWDSPERQLPNTSSNRPPGVQRFGPWAIFVDGLKAEGFSLIVYHRCANLWPTVTILGPFPAEELGL